MTARIAISPLLIEQFCQKWAVTELSLFGSVIRSDFGEESDVDVMVEFSPGAGRTLFDIVLMEDELRTIFGRDVDLVVKSTIAKSRNHLRRQTILDAAEVVYAA